MEGEVWRRERMEVYFIMVGADGNTISVGEGTRG